MVGVGGSYPSAEGYSIAPTDWVIKDKKYAFRDNEFDMIYRIIFYCHEKKNPGFSHCQFYHIYPTPPLGQDMTQGQCF